MIGRGGMGTVEAALEIGTDSGVRLERESGGAFQRVVALKRLLPDAARDSRRVDMFLREAKLAAMLDHPNVVRAYDYGELDGELFLAMEYVEGQALSRVLHALEEGGGELGPSLTAHVLAEVCDGLHAAHELADEAGQPLQLVHRDVSPQNVMLAYDGHVRLLDFGVAKIEAESVTKTGEVKGKTAYMSPEQAMGDPIDRRSDLFGVGAVLFECLALRRMWGDGTDMDVIRKLALEKPPRLEDVVKTAPPELCALYTRLVAREATDRPATAAEVAKELRALVPQGREEATRAVRLLLEKHFGKQAEEQRRQLTMSLEEVAPEQARELRESLSPEAMPAPQSRRSHGGRAPAPASSSRSVADATGANRALNGDALSAGVEGASREGRSRFWLGAFAIAIGAVVIWRLTTPASPPDTGAQAMPSRTGALIPSNQHTSSGGSAAPAGSPSAAPAGSPSVAPARSSPSVAPAGSPSAAPAGSPSGRRITVAPGSGSVPRVLADPKIGAQPSTVPGQSAAPVGSVLRTAAPVDSVLPL